MEKNPDPAQTLLLWHLATHGGEAWLADLPATLASKPRRSGLIRDGLIAEEKQPRPRPGKRTVQALRLTLQEKGWAWLADHLQAPLSPSKAAAEVLQGLLAALQLHLERHRLALADFLVGDHASGDAAVPESDTGDSGAGDSDTRQGEAALDAMGQGRAGQGRAVAPQPATGDFQPPACGGLQPAGGLAAATDAAPDDSVAERITAAYAVLAEHRSNGRVRLAALRSELADLPRETLDTALQRMLRAGKLVLGRLDNPLEITPEDDAAKLLTALGDPRHIMHMEIPAHV